MLDTPSAHHVRERTAGPTTVVELHGEIDMLTAPAISVRLDGLTAGPRPEVVVDLRSVTFIDCSGLSILCRTRNRTVGRGGRLGLVVDDHRILRTLCLTGLAGAFDLHSSLPDALAPAD